MLDYGKVQTFLYREGKELPKKPAVVPIAPKAFRQNKPREWDEILATLGFEPTCWSEARWIFTTAPTHTRLGTTVIVCLNEDDGHLYATVNIDTVATENDTAFEDLPRAYEDPLQAAKYGLRIIRKRLSNALKALG